MIVNTNRMQLACVTTGFWQKHLNRRHVIKVSILRPAQLISSLLFLRKKVKYFNLVFSSSFNSYPLGKVRVTVFSSSSYFSKESSNICPYSFTSFLVKQILFFCIFSCSRYSKAIYSNEFQIWIDGSSVGNHVSHYIFKTSLHPALKLKSTSSREVMSPERLR